MACWYSIMALSRCLASRRAAPKFKCGQSGNVQCRVTPDVSAYPPELAALGIQGVVNLDVNVTREGTITSIRPSPSPFGAELTDAGVAVAKTLSFKDAARPEAPETTVIVSIYFEKDTMATLVGKTCADFNIDDAARKATTPVQDLVSMHAFKIARDLILAHAFSGSYETLVPRPQRPDDDPAIKLATEERCASQPDLLFFQVLQQEMLSAAKAKHRDH